MGLCEALFTSHCSLVEIFLWASCSICWGVAFQGNKNPFPANEILYLLCWCLGFRLVGFKSFHSAFFLGGNYNNLDTYLWQPTSNRHICCRHRSELLVEFCNRARAWERTVQEKDLLLCSPTSQLLRVTLVMELEPLFLQPYHLPHLVSSTSGQFNLVKRTYNE